MTSRTKKTEASAFTSLREHPVAVVGLGAIFPEAENIAAYWQNIYDELDCLTDVPSSRWDIESYYDPNPAAPDQSYSKRGAFIPDVPFNPMEFGLPPNILDVTDSTQLLALVTAKQALRDAGLLDASEEVLSRCGVVLGMVGIGSKVALSLSARLQYPIWQRALENIGLDEESIRQAIAKMQAAYVDWNENAFPGALGNVVAGRITNRFNLGGANFTTDAACASSLAAISAAVNELVVGRADVMLTGGVDLDNSILTYLCFSKTPALSKGDSVAAFDESADGMLPGEGVGMLVLKRLTDAERDGNRIYAVIRGVGSSSDGRYKSIYAPRPEGQALALRRAYAEAGFPPQSVGLIEAHGTGTPAGDPAEFSGLKQVFTPREANDSARIALGSVKSQIGHTKAAAGSAGMIKAVLALHHKVLPGTLHVKHPNSKFGLEDSLFYINSETRPWLPGKPDEPRRAGVSAFGFGGTNYHMVLEEYLPEPGTASRLTRGADMVLLHAETPAGLTKDCEQLLAKLQSADAPAVYHTLIRSTETILVPPSHARLGFAAVDMAEALALLELALLALRQEPQSSHWEHPRGIYYRRAAIETSGKVVALFPGQGSQYVNMGQELAMMYPPVREVYTLANALRSAEGMEAVSRVVFPEPVFSPEAGEANTKRLTQTENAQPAIGCTSAAMYQLLTSAGLQPDFYAGHSFGELTALWAAGAFDLESYLHLTIARGNAMAGAAKQGTDAGTMLAVKGDADTILKAVEGMPNVWAANVNSHQQVVLAGTKEGIAAAQASLSAQGLNTVPLAVSAAFHSPLVAQAQKPFALALEKVQFHPVRGVVFSNNTAQPYPQDPEEMRALFANHMPGMVNFRDEIQLIYEAGGRIFIEIGPRSTLTNLVGNILEGQDFVSLSINPNHRADGDLQLRQAYLHLKVLGLPLGVLDRWYRWPEMPAVDEKTAATVTLNGGLYHSERFNQHYASVMNNGYQIQKENSMMETKSQQSQLQPVQESTQPTAATQPAGAAPQNFYAAANGHGISLHEKYLQTSEEFNRALAAMSQVEQELLRLGMHNGNHAHLETVLKRMARLMDHQEALLAMHASLLQRQPTTIPVSTPATANPQSILADYVVVQTPVSVPAPAATAVNEPEPALKMTLPAVEAAPVQVAQPKPTLPHKNDAVGQDIAGMLLTVVAEKTGYPADTISLDMNMEADLGIDSIKRVEILGAMQENLQGVDGAAMNMEALSNLGTLQEVVDFLSQMVGVLEKNA